MNNAFKRIADGTCIYCGRPDDQLTEEHIVPFALGGKHTLDAAVCEQCQTSFNREIETPLLQNALLQSRAKYGWRSRKNKKRLISSNTLIPLPTDPNSGTLSPETVRARDYRGPSMLLRVAERPRLLTGRTGGISIGLVSDSDGMKPGTHYISSMRLEDLDLMAKLLMKIGHAYCHFEGVKSFTPFLKDGMWNPCLFVGAPSSAEPIAATGLNYGMELREENRLLIVKVQLFALGPLVYSHDVIVGGLPGWAMALPSKQRQMPPWHFA